MTPTNRQPLGLRLITASPAVLGIGNAVDGAMHLSINKLALAICWGGAAAWSTRTLAQTPKTPKAPNPHCPRTARAYGHFDQRRPPAKRAPGR